MKSFMYVCVFGRDTFYSVYSYLHRCYTMQTEESSWDLFVHVITLLVNKINMLKGLRRSRRCLEDTKCISFCSHET
jgi:hypothetical protein